MSDASEEIETQAVKQEDYLTSCLRRIDEWRAKGIDPFGGRFDDTEPVSAVRASFNAEAAEQPKHRVAGRLMAHRAMGKSVFADIKDSSGRIQLYVNKNVLGDGFDDFKNLDVGDIIGADGELFTTRTGELTLKLHGFRLLSKSIRTLPEKWHGLTDVEARYRQRYVDLIMNDQAREVFKKRFAIVRGIRSFLEKAGFTEVETPMIQAIPGGAAARPFKTFYEALHCEMFMRIAPELYLKRLLVAGFEKVFELNRNFRNEGLSRRHNPEFTMLEIYQAYGDCRTMMDLVEGLVVQLANDVIGSLKIQHGEDRTIDLTPPWRRVDYRSLVKEKAGDDWFTVAPDERVRSAAALGLTFEGNPPDHVVTNEVYEKLVEPTLLQPTFVTRIPAELVPLAKRCGDDPSVVDVFELEINGQEIAPGYSELNDPIEQRRRFESQITLDGNGEEAVVHDGKIDEDFLNAIEHGMPPAGGMGIGIDRLVMLLTGADSIRDVILFPHMRPRKTG